MRSSAVEKLGFYLISIRVIEALKTWFAPVNDGRLLRPPSAGEGSAEGLLAKVLNCTSWGVELSPARAQVAEKNMDRFLCEAWQTCTLTNESITLLFLNSHTTMTGSGISAGWQFNSSKPPRRSSCVVAL
jgi:hypothetical protein